MTLLPWPLHPSDMHKNRRCLISLLYLSLTNISSNTETDLKKNHRPVSVCLSYIKGNPTLGNQKEGFHVSKTIRIFKGGPQLTYNRSKPIESSAPSFFFLSLLWMWILRVIDHLIKFSPKESDPFHTAQEFRRKTPPPPLQAHTNTLAPSNITKWLPFADKKDGNKMIK